MHRFIQIDVATDRCRGQRAERTAEDAGFVGKNVAEQVFGEHNVKAGGRGYQAHCAGVNVSVLELHVGIFFPEQRDHLAPELRSFKNVGLIDRGHFLAALASEFECHAADAFDLFDRVAHGVECCFAICANKSARLAEIQSPEQFTDEHNVGATNDVFFQRRTICDARINNRRTKIGEAFQRFAQAKQTSFDTLFGRKVVILRGPYGSEENGVALETGLDSVRRKRRSELIDGHSAHGALGELEFVIVQVRHAAQDAHRFPRNFGTDAVAGQDRDFQLSTWGQLQLLRPYLNTFLK